MKILIGTPIHQKKDYAIERWLENVSKLEYPADLLMVDNSPGIEYMERAKGYCKRIGLKKYLIKHIEHIIIRHFNFLRSVVRFFLRDKSFYCVWKIH